MTRFDLFACVDGASAFYRGPDDAPVLDLPADDRYRVGPDKAEALCVVCGVVFAKKQAHWRYCTDLCAGRARRAVGA